MTLEISSALLKRLLDEAGQSPDREICGLLLGTPERVTAALACRNAAADPTRTFEIDPAALIAAHRAARSGGAPIAGCYHSHPGGRAEPSERDATDAAPDGAIWLILGSGNVACYRAAENGRHHRRFEPLAYRAV